MINFSSQIVNDATIKRFVKECPERFSDAIETATNRAAARIRYLVKRETPNKWGIKKDEMKNFKLRRALKRQGNLTASVVLRGSNVPLFRFLNITPRNVMGGQTTGGVSAMIAGQSHKFAHAFVAKMPTGHIGIFNRTGQKTKTEKAELKELTTAAITGMTASEQTDIPNKIAPIIQEEFENAFKREAVAWLNLLGAK